MLFLDMVEVVAIPTIHTSQKATLYINFNFIAHVRKYYDRMMKI